jgi:hypothetical protein
MTTYVINPITNELESAQPRQTVGDKFKLQTFVREKFSLGSKDPSQEIKTVDGETAGALMDAFPNQSFLEYQNALDQGFQGTFEEYLQINSLDKSELDIGEQNMKAIEGQTALGVLRRLIKPSDEAAEAAAKIEDINPRGTELSLIKKKKPKNLTKEEKIFLDDTTKKFKALAANPLYKDLIPKKFKNVKSITELSQSDLNKINKNFIDFQYKSITDEKGLGPFSTLNKRFKQQVKSMYSFREAAKKRPDFFSLKIAGDTFNLPYTSGLTPKAFKKLEKIYPVFKKIEANPTVENYQKQIGKLDRGEKVTINDIQAYLTGNDTRVRSVFDSPQQIRFLKSLDLENKLSEETIELIKAQKGQAAANVLKQVKATKESAKINLAKVNTKSIKRINEIYSADPDATAKDVIDQYYGDALQKASAKERKQMLKDLRNDVITYYRVATKARKPVKGVRLPSKQKVDDILTSIMDAKGKDGFDIYGGYLRNIYSDIADSITKPGFKYISKTSSLSKQFPGQHVDHSVGLSAVHEAAPGYVEAIQIIPKSVNQDKGRLLDRVATGIINDFFTDSPNKPRKIGDEIYNTFEEKVNAFNTISKQFGDVNNIDTPLLRFGEPGKGPSPKETVEHFTEFSEGAQKNMMEVWNNHGFVIYTKSHPMGSSFWTKTKPMKNMGGLISREGFANGTQIDQFLEAAGKIQLGDNLPVIPGNEPDYSELQVMLDNPNEYNTFPKGTFTEELDKAVYGTNEERNLLQKFNSMFLDPRVYPYYAQKIGSGAANIPELAFRFPAALAYLYGQGNLALASGDLDRIKGKTLMEALEILDPKYTREIKNTKFGDVIGISDKSMDEQDKTEGQKFVGDTFELAAEAVGPATPLFLFKMFPKLPKQIKDLVGTASAAEKVNKEIEKNMAVDQTRRDLILTIGAGGAAAALKFLGLDKLIKAPKATKAVTSAVKSGGTPQYFFDFVDLIKRKGKDVSDRQAVVERQKVIEYKDYTLTDTDGYITVRKTDEDMGRDEMMEYKPPEGVVDETTGRSTEVPAQYEEVTAKPDANDPGNFDADQGFDSIDQVLEELAKDGKKYTVKELEEMGINTFVGDEIFPNKVEKAKGGIIAGVKSGPAPKSGPTPHGLPYLVKNVTPIKERK